MNDMSSVIVPKSDQINADDLIGGPMTITIREVIIRGGEDQPVSIAIEGSKKYFRPCKSMSRVLVANWGPDANKYVGRSLTLYRDPTVKWGGMEVGGIRISHMSHIESAMTMALTATKGSRKPYTVKPLLAEVRQIEDAASALTIQDAEARLRAAFDLDELRTIWLAKAMQPFRDQLGNVLAEMKAALSVEADTNSDRGESNALDADQIIAFINSKTRTQDVNELVASHTDTIMGFSEDDRERVAKAQTGRIAQIRAAA